MSRSFANPRIELLALPPTHKHTLDKVIPEPRPNLPEYYPPGYESISLNQKAPNIKVPNGEPLFFRDRVGKKLFVRKGCQFDLNDPYMRNISYEYDPLHDPALKRHFHQSKVTARLKNRRILGPNGEAYCSLEAYNKYRRFLYGCHIDRVNKVRRIVNERENDFRNVRHAIRESSRADNPYKARIKAAKAEAMRRNIQEEQKRHQNFERAEFKRQIATKRAGEMVRKKSRRIHEAFEKNKRQFEKNTEKITKRAFHRRLLMNKCNVLKSELAEKRKAQVHLKQLNERSQRQRTQRDRQFAWREAKEKYIHNLLELQEERHTNNVVRRMAKIKQHQAKLEHEIAAKRMRSLGKSYESTEVSNIVKKIMKNIKLLFEAEYIEQNTKTRRGLNDRPTVYELLNEDVVRLAVECTYRNVRQLKIPLTIRTIIEESVTCLQRFAQGHGEDQLHQDSVACNFVQKEILAIIEQAKEGIRLFLSNPNYSNNELSFIRDEIHHIIQQTNVDQLLNTPELVRNEIDNIIQQSTDQIKQKLDSVCEEFIRNETLNIIEQMISNDEEEIPEQNPSKRGTKDRTVSFVYHSDINIPSSSLMSAQVSICTMQNASMRNSFDRTPTPICSISQMVSIEMRKLKNDKPEPPPDRMNTVDLIHFHSHQKIAVAYNLTRFAHYFRMKLERFCDNLRFGGKSVPNSIRPGEEDTIMEAMVKSILTYSDQDFNFGRNTVMLANWVWSQIMHEFETNIA